MWIRRKFSALFKLLSCRVDEEDDTLLYLAHSSHYTTTDQNVWILYKKITAYARIVTEWGRPETAKCQRIRIGSGRWFCYVLLLLVQSARH